MRLISRAAALPRDRRTHAVAGLDLDVHAGECWAIVGPNSAGRQPLSLRWPASASGLRRDRGTPLALGPRGALCGATCRRIPCSFRRPSSRRHSSVIRTSRWQWGPAPMSPARTLRSPPSGSAESTPRCAHAVRRRAATSRWPRSSRRIPRSCCSTSRRRTSTSASESRLDVVTGLARERGRRSSWFCDLHLALRYADHAIAQPAGAHSPRRGDILTAAAMSSSATRSRGSAKDSVDIRRPDAAGARRLRARHSDHLLPPLLLQASSSGRLRRTPSMLGLTSNARRE